MFSFNFGKKLIILLKLAPLGWSKKIKSAAPAGKQFDSTP